MKIMWPFPASIFRILNFLEFWTQQVSPSLLSRDYSRIQMQKTPMIPDFCLLRQVSHRSLNTDARNVEDINIPHITECLSLSFVASFEHWFCLFCT